MPVPRSVRVTFSPVTGGITVACGVCNCCDVSTSMYDGDILVARYMGVWNNLDYVALCVFFFLPLPTASPVCCKGPAWASVYLLWIAKGWGRKKYIRMYGRNGWLWDRRLWLFLRVVGLRRWVL